MIKAINILFRKIFCRGGHRVHSPFVYDLITTVIEEKRPYYCYKRLSTIRKKLQKNCAYIKYDGRIYTVKEVLKKYCLTENEDRLLFRLANRFRPTTTYVMGSDLGLALLYLTSWSEYVNCVVLEPEESVAHFASKIVDKYSSAYFDIRVFYNTRIEDNENIDFIVLNSPFCIDAYKIFLPHINDNSIMVVTGINASQKSRDTWKAICDTPKVTVTLDLYNLGIALFNPKLHRRTYKCTVL